MPTEKQRREAEHRRLQRQLQRRRERETSRRRFSLVASVVGAVAVIAVVLVFLVATNDDDRKPAAAGTTSGAASAPASSATSASSADASKEPAYPCTWAKAGSAARTVTVPSSTTPSRTGTVTIAVGTTRGAMTFTLNRAAAPCAVASFVSLAAQHYFDNTPCHRLTSATTLSVLQCGDPTGTGSGGPGYSFADELTGHESYARGVLAMANSGENTNGSQFFIVYKNSSLPAKYTIFGKVSAGLGVVDAVAAKGSTPAQDGKPRESISFTTVRS